MFYRRNNKKCGGGGGTAAVEARVGCLEVRGWYGSDGDVPIYKVVQKGEMAGIFSDGRRLVGGSAGEQERERATEYFCVCVFYFDKNESKWGVWGIYMVEEV